MSVKLPSNGISYSEVCGRVIGYQYASPDAADTRNRNSSVHNNINTFYWMVLVSHMGILENIFGA